MRRAFLLAASLLLVGLGIPGAAGHDDRGDDPAGANARGVSGHYVGAAGLAVLDSGDNNPGRTEGKDTLNSFGQMQCDLESGGGPPAANDERLVDGAPGGLFQDATFGALPNPGPVAGVHTGFDDGGFGGACHVNSYLWAPYNTPGCEQDAVAHAHDVAFLGNVWIAATCDWETDVGGGADACGADGTADGWNLGFGGPGVPYPYAASDFGEAFKQFSPADTDGDVCNQADATMAVFVFVAIDVDADQDGVPLAPAVYPVTHGDIWQA